MSERLVVFTERDEGPVPGLDEELIRQNGGTVRYGRAADEQDRIRLAEGAEVIVAGITPLRRELLAALPRLKGVVRLGIGVDSVDLDAATELGIVVANVPDFCAEEVAEHALGLIFAVTRKLALADRKSRARRMGSRDRRPLAADSAAQRPDPRADRLGENRTKPGRARPRVWD